VLARLPGNSNRHAGGLIFEAPRDPALREYRGYVRQWHNATHKSQATERTPRLKAKPMDTANPTTHHRVFTAIWPDEGVRRALLEAQRAFELPESARPVRPERLHITLNFLDRLPGEMVKALVALELPFQPFTLELTRAALLNREIAILEPEQPPAALIELHARLSIALAEMRLPLDLRAFRPHVTLARDARGAKIPRNVTPVSWRVESWIVVESTSGSTPEYRRLS
jgi:2'-5' RNA ligase